MDTGRTRGRQGWASRQETTRDVRADYSEPIPRLPELAFLGVSDTSRAWENGSADHRHDGLEINYLHQGSLRWWAGSDWYQVLGGDVFITWPGEPHGGPPHLVEPCSLYWLQVSLWDGGQSGDRTLLDLPAAEARSLVEALRSLPHRQFRAGPGVHEAFRRLVECVSAGEDSMVLVEARLRLLQLLVEVVNGSRADEHAHYSSLVVNALLYMARYPDRRVPLEEVAGHLHCSLPHLKTRFRAEVGMSPASHHALYRVRLAAGRLLERDESITRVALTLGFGSAQYFSTMFKRWMGVTPQQYRDGVGGRATHRRTPVRDVAARLPPLPRQD